MKCDFVVGQRVVCINGDWPEWAVSTDERFIVPGPVRVPMLNEVLTIAGIQAGTRLVTMSAVWLAFEEIAGGWHYSHFRPLIERKTDISMFKRMLTPAKKAVDA